VVTSCRAIGPPEPVRGRARTTRDPTAMHARSLVLVLALSVLPAASAPAWAKGAVEPARDVAPLTAGASSRFT
jgi:hypothetical protein